MPVKVESFDYDEQHSRKRHRETASVSTPALFALLESQGEGGMYVRLHAQSLSNIQHSTRRLIVTEEQHRKADLRWQCQVQTAADIVAYSMYGDKWTFEACKLHDGTAMLVHLFPPKYFMVEI